MPEWLILVLAVLTACATVTGAVVLRQRRADGDDPSETPDVIEYMTMMTGVVYAIVLGLAIAGVWEARNVAEGVATDEAQALHEVHERARAAPAADRERIRSDVAAYVHHTVATEWPYMVEHGRLTRQGGELLTDLRKDVLDWEPRTSREEQAYAAMAERVAAVDAARTSRAGSTEPTLPGVVWLGLFAGAVDERAAAGRHLHGADRVPALPRPPFRRAVRTRAHRSGRSVHSALSPGRWQCHSWMRC